MKSTLTTTMFKHPSSMFLGMTMRATLNRLLENGNISSEEFGKVYNAAHHYFRDSYIQEKFPITHDVISNLGSNLIWVDVIQRCEASWENVQVFIGRYSTLKSFKGLDNNKVYEEFIDNQKLRDNDFPVEAFDDPKSMKEKLMRERFTITESTQCGFKSTKCKLLGLQ